MLYAPSVGFRWNWVPALSVSATPVHGLSQSRMSSLLQGGDCWAFIGAQLQSLVISRWSDCWAFIGPRLQSSVIRVIFGSPFKTLAGEEGTPVTPTQRWKVDWEENELPSL